MTLSSDCLCTIGKFLEATWLFSLACTSRLAYRALSNNASLLNGLTMDYCRRCNWYPFSQAHFARSAKQRLFFLMNHRCLITTYPPSHTLPIVESVYNENYRCKVYHVILAADFVQVFFHVKGNMSLGLLQDPGGSKLRVTFRENSISSTHVYFAYGTDVDNKKYGATREYEGSIKYYRKDWPKKPILNISWSYGESGYTSVSFPIDPVSIAKFKLYRVL